jgi:hypothetical protein
MKNKSQIAAPECCGQRNSFGGPIGVGTRFKAVHASRRQPVEMIIKIEHACWKRLRRYLETPGESPVMAFVPDSLIPCRTCDSDDAYLVGIRTLVARLEPFDPGECFAGHIVVKGGISHQEAQRRNFVETAPSIKPRGICSL